MANNLHVGEIGVTLKLDTGLDLTGATTLQILAQNPSKQKKTWTASDSGTPTDGIVQYDTVSGDLDIAGNWRFQAKVVTGGKTYLGDVAELQIYKEFEL